jgi:hypothetical protein
VWKWKKKGKGKGKGKGQLSGAPGSDRLRLNRTEESVLYWRSYSIFVSILWFYSVSIDVFYPFPKVSSPYRVLSHLHLLAACVHACMKRMYVRVRAIHERQKYLRNRKEREYECADSS